MLRFDCDFFFQNHGGNASGLSAILHHPEGVHVLANPSSRPNLVREMGWRCAEALVVVFAARLSPAGARNIKEYPGGIFVIRAPRGSTPSLSVSAMLVCADTTAAAADATKMAAWFSGENSAGMVVPVSSMPAEHDSDSANQARAATSTLLLLRKLSHASPEHVVTPKRG